MDNPVTSKEGARRFLTRLEAYLNSEIPAPVTVRAEIAAAVEKASRRLGEPQTAAAPSRKAHS